MIRTINNNALRLSNVGETHVLVGWCAKKRNLGGLLFIDLRDRYGITQLVVNPDSSCYEVASSVRNEYVLKATGKVVERTSKNPSIATGDVELVVS
ncbi:MAG: OB-fold nucleic acid binding domain-containing protein, partial [Bacilli bacterium]